MVVKDGNYLESNDYSFQKNAVILHTDANTFEHAGKHTTCILDLVYLTMSIQSPTLSVVYVQ